MTDNSRVAWRGPLGANHAAEHAYPTPNRNMLSAARRRDKSLPLTKITVNGKVRSVPKAGPVRFGYILPDADLAYRLNGRRIMEVTHEERAELAKRRNEERINDHLERQQRRAEHKNRIYAQMAQIDTWADHH